jgi:hypothetical protein
MFNDENLVREPREVEGCFEARPENCKDRISLEAMKLDK